MQLPKLPIRGSIPFARSSTFLRHSRQNLNPCGICGVLGQDDGRTPPYSASTVAAVVHERARWWTEPLGMRAKMRAQVFSIPCLHFHVFR